MRIGIIVDGKGEVGALPRIFPNLKLRKGDQPIPAWTLYADLQPKASAGQIARRAMSRVRILRQEGADSILLLIDREDREECAPEFAQAIKTALEGMGERVSVVVKNRTLENWLIADPKGLASLSGRFKLTNAFVGRVSPNKADNVRNGAAMLDRISINRSYHKTLDPPKILGAMDVGQAGKNSRSFRRFLRLVGDKRYRDQSKKP